MKWFRKNLIQALIWLLIMVVFLKKMTRFWCFKMINIRHNEWWWRYNCFNWASWKKDYIHINFGEKIVRIEGKDLDKITLGYAISIHKSQGSEYKNVILPIVPSFQIMLKPNLIYTAVTRAKGKLIILGNSQTLINSLYQKMM